MQHSPDDLELIARYKKSGDMAVLAQLYQRYTHLVYGLCLKYLKDREESQDAVMQIFEKLRESLKQHEVQYFKSWLYVTSKNHCLILLRARKKELKLRENIAEETMENQLLLHHEEEQGLEQNLGKLEKCIEELAEEQKSCVKLFYLEEQCYKDIAQATGYDLKKVKSYIQNGKRNLKICMERKDE
ncbi:MAG TPA: RNA polymerase sigma factor [Cyclobacteriaceae bacterium]|nr:RNA polymerase sigma factor [Cyclobacteriaceae bacterium]